MPGSDEGITAVMSLAAVNNQGAGTGKKLSDRFGNAKASNFHQALSALPSRKSSLFRCFHLEGSDDHDGIKLAQASPRRAGQESGESLPQSDYWGRRHRQ